MGNTPAKKTAAKKAPAKPDQVDQVEEARDQITKSEAAAQAEFEARVQEASDNLTALEETVTQREWLLVTAALDRTRDQIAQDGSLRMLALAWVREKHDHGGASWDALLDMTDRDLVRLHGFPEETPEETKERLERNARLAADSTEE